VSYCPVAWKDDLEELGFAGTLSFSTFVCRKKNTNVTDMQTPRHSLMKLVQACSIS
jgi:hypothetical protein